MNIITLIDRFTSWLLGYTVEASPYDPVEMPPEFLDTEDSGERAEIWIRNRRRQKH